MQTSNATFIHTDQIDQQFAISRLRAIETDRYVVVAAINGLTGVIAPDGSVVIADHRRGPRPTPRHGSACTTRSRPAVRIGPWLGRGCVGLVAVGLLWALALGLGQYRRTRRSDPVVGLVSRPPTGPRMTRHRPAPRRAPGEGRA